MKGPLGAKIGTTDITADKLMELLYAASRFPLHEFQGSVLQ